MKDLLTCDRCGQPSETVLEIRTQFRDSVLLDPPCAEEFWEVFMAGKVVPA